MKKSKKGKKIVGIILLPIGIGCISLGLFGKEILPKKVYNKLFDIVEKKIIHDDIPKPVVKESKVSLMMVGDSLIHSAVYANVKKGNTYDFKPIYSEIRDVFKDSELRYYNQETIIGGSELGLSSYPQFNSPYESADAYMDMGFNLVSLATNHTMDKGMSTKYKTIINSREYWNKQKDVIATGSFATQEQKDEVVIKEINGIKYGLLSYTTYTNGLPVPKGKEYYANVYSEELAKKDIEKIRDKVDLLMVAMHWGTEYSLSETAAQKEIAKYLSSLGVNIIIGTHPHVVEPIDYVNDTLVIYSLGNFISAQQGDERLTGLLAKVDITKTTIDDKTYVKLSNTKADLVYTCKPQTCGKGSYKIYPYTKLTKAMVPNKDNYYKKYMGIVTKYDKNIGTIFTKEG